jgi:hypothetical protein
LKDIQPGDFERHSWGVFDATVRVRDGFKRFVVLQNGCFRIRDTGFLFFLVQMRKILGCYLFELLDEYLNGIKP